MALTPHNILIILSVVSETLAAFGAGTINWMCLGFAFALASLLV